LTQEYASICFSVILFNHLSCDSHLPVMTEVYIYVTASPWQKTFSRCKVRSTRQLDRNATLNCHAGCLVQWRDGADDQFMKFRECPWLRQQSSRGSITLRISVDIQARSRRVANCFTCAVRSIAMLTAVLWQLKIRTSPDVHSKIYNSAIFFRPC
jgi:hypothetical protein